MYLPSKMSWQMRVCVSATSVTCWSKGERLISSSRRRGGGALGIAVSIRQRGSAELPMNAASSCASLSSGQAVRSREAARQWRHVRLLCANSDSGSMRSSRLSGSVGQRCADDRG